MYSFLCLADVCSPTPGKSPAEPVDTIVPTIVGCVLAGLIVILIITYFVGRCKRTGYEKMWLQFCGGSQLTNCDWEWCDSDKTVLDNGVWYLKLSEYLKASFTYYED